VAPSRGFEPRIVRVTTGCVTDSARRVWYPRPDSNLRPSRCKRSAHPAHHERGDPIRTLGCLALEDGFEPAGSAFSGRALPAHHERGGPERTLQQMCLWHQGNDSNARLMVQSHVSYRLGDSDANRFGAPDGNRTRQPLLDRRCPAHQERGDPSRTTARAYWKNRAVVRRGGFAPPQPCGHGFTARWVRSYPSRHTNTARC
jgi:hypothetical protein